MAKAFFSSGLFVSVPPGAVEEIRVDFPRLSAAGGLPAFFNVFSIGDDARVTVFENNAAPAPFIASTEVFSGAGSSLEFASMHSGAGNFVAQKRFFVGGNARVDSFSGFFGGSLCKAEAELVLDAPGGFGSDSVACAASGRQHFDLSSVITHAAPSTKAHSVAKSVLWDSGRVVSWGRIRVLKGARKSDSFLAQNALVLNAGARADCMPTLEIEENDVRATHSSGVTHVDDNALFYLSSRGIPRPDGRRLLADSFLEGAVDKLRCGDARREFVVQLHLKWLEEAKVTA